MHTEARVLASRMCVMAALLTPRPLRVANKNFANGSCTCAGTHFAGRIHKQI